MWNDLDEYGHYLLIRTLKFTVYFAGLGVFIWRNWGETIETIQFLSDCFVLKRHDAVIRDGIDHFDYGILEAGNSIALFLVTFAVAYFICRVLDHFANYSAIDEATFGHQEKVLNTFYKRLRQQSLHTDHFEDLVTAYSDLQQIVKAMQPEVMAIRLELDAIAELKKDRPTLLPQSDNMDLFETKVLPSAPKKTLPKKYWKRAKNHVPPTF